MRHTAAPFLSITPCFRTCPPMPLEIFILFASERAAASCHHIGGLACIQGSTPLTEAGPQELLKDCAFVAIDEEMTGIKLDRFDSILFCGMLPSSVHSTSREQRSAPAPLPLCHLADSTAWWQYDGTSWQRHARDAICQDEEGGCDLQHHTVWSLRLHKRGGGGRIRRASLQLFRVSRQEREGSHLDHHGEEHWAITSFTPRTPCSQDTPCLFPRQYQTPPSITALVSSAHRPTFSR